MSAASRPSASQAHGMSPGVGIIVRGSNRRAAASTPRILRNAHPLP
jgi:hypothetical protein